MNQVPVQGAEQAEEVAGTVADVTLHIQGVLEAAERAAAASIEQARAEGARRVGEAKQRAQELVSERKERVSAISDDLLRQAEAVEGRLAKLDDALGTALEDLRRELERLPAPPEGDGFDADEDDLEEDADVDGDSRRTIFSR